MRYIGQLSSISEKICKMLFASTLAKLPNDYFSSKQLLKTLNLTFFYFIKVQMTTLYHVSFEKLLPWKKSYFDVR